MKQRLNSATGVFRQVLGSGWTTPYDDQINGHRLPFIGLTRIPPFHQLTLDQRSRVNGKPTPGVTSPYTLAAAQP